MLGAMGEEDPRIVPIAFHVDHFNDPWKEVFSDELYSRRQMAYNQLYTQPKHPDCGLYHTSMIMIDGEQSVNGLDGASARSMIRRALGRKPAVAIDVNLALDPGLRGHGHRQGDEPGRPCRENAAAGLRRAPRGRAVTHVASGENAGKLMVAQFPARRTKYEFIELDGKTPAKQRFPFAIEPTWDRRHLRLALFVQDKRSGAVHQAKDLPWQTTSTTGDSSTPAEKAAAGTH